jgi:uncharacterized repeat protein (TIGR03803 family)
MNSLTKWKTACVVFAFCVAMAISSPAQTFTNLATFDVTDGAFPNAPLLQGLDGNFYGTTTNGGRQLCKLGCGTFFSVTPSGTLTPLHNFVNTDGANPQGTLVLGTNGNFYGTTATGSGLNGNGIAFEITTAGTPTTLAQFEPNNGATPYGGLMQDNVNQNFYGTTYYGNDGGGAGTVFAMTLLVR